jgi:hypothetical protein
MSKYYREISKQTAPLQIKDTLSPFAVVDLLNKALIAEGLKIKTIGLEPSGFLVKISKEVKR